MVDKVAATTITVVDIMIATANITAAIAAMIMKTAATEETVIITTRIFDKNQSWNPTSMSF